MKQISKTVRQFDKNNPIDVFLEKMEKQILSVSKNKLSDKECSSMRKEANEAVAILLNADPNALSRIDILYFLPYRKDISGAHLFGLKSDEIIAGLLHIAVYLQAPFYIEAILDKGTDINLRDTTGFTPLHYLALSGSTNQYECLQILQQDVRLSTDTLSYNGWSAFSLIGACNKRTAPDLFIELMPKSELSQNDLGTLRHLSITRFKEIAKTHKKILKPDVLKRLIQMVTDDKLKAYLISINTNYISEENTLEIFKFLSHIHNFSDFFLKRQSQYKAKNSSEYVYKIFQALIHNSNVYKDMVDQFGNNILHLVFFIVSYYIKKSDELKDNFLPNFNNLILPIINVYSHLLTKKNKAGYTPLAYTQFKEEDDKQDDQVKKLIMGIIEEKQGAELPLFLLRQETDKDQFLSLLINSHIRNEVLEALYLNHEEILVELLNPLNINATYLYPEMITIIDTHSMKKPSKMLLSVLRLQLAIACDGLRPLYINLVQQLNDYFEHRPDKQNKNPALYPHARVLLREVNDFIYSSLDAMKANTLLGLRANISKYRELINTIIAEVAENRREMRPVTLEQFKVLKNAIEIESLTSKEKEGWKLWKEKKYDFVTTLYRNVYNFVKQDLSAIVKHDKEKTKAFCEFTNHLMEGLTKYEETYFELIDIYLSCYGIDIDSLKKRFFITQNLQVNEITFKTLFEFKENMVNLNKISNQTTLLVPNVKDHEKVSFWSGLNSELSLENTEMEFEKFMELLDDEDEFVPKHQRQ